MSGKNQHDWVSLKQKLIEGLQNGDLKPADGWASAATYIGVNESTMRNAIKREWKVKTLEDLVESGMVEEASKRLGTDVKETPNMLDITYVGEHARTLEELIARCKVDTNVWECVNVYPNSWNSAMKIREGDVERIVVVPLYQVKATFRRINPRPIMPMFQPLEVVFPKAARPPSAPKREGGLRRALIVPDPQIGFRRRLHNHTLDPFHDRQVLDLAVQIARAEGVDSMEFIGDWLDLSEFSTRWTPEPEFYWTTMPALIEAAYWLGAFGNTVTKRLLQGNHEKRIQDWINQYARPAYGLRAVDELELPPSLSVERLIPMEKLGVQYLKGYPDNGYWLNKNVFIEHGDVVRSAAGATAGAVVNKTTYTTIFGHIHRRELVSRRVKTRDGDAFQTAFCPGCACRVDGVVPGSTSKDQWQQGLGLVEYTEETQNIIPIAVERGEAIFGGRVYRARPAGDLDAELDAMIESALAKMRM